MSVDVKEIAGRLSHAQKAAILDELFSLRSGVSRVRRQLVALDLAMTSGVLNNDGLAVRNHLLATEPTA